jgi:4-hydroxy-tetrahydrodipicolinate synthase
LVLLGRIPYAAVRPPLVKIGESEIARIRTALERAGVGREGAIAEAA